MRQLVIKLAYKYNPQLSELLERLAYIRRNPWDEDEYDAIFGEDGVLDEVLDSVGRNKWAAVQR